MDEAELQTKLQSIEKRLGRVEKDPKFDFHQHTGTDSNKVFYQDLEQKIIWKEHTIYGADAATAANYGGFYIIPDTCYIVDFREVHQVAGTDGGTVSLDLEKLTSGQAPGAGTVLTSSALSLKATANVVQTATLITTLTSINLAKSDRLSLKIGTSVLTSVSNVTVLIGLILL